MFPLLPSQPCARPMTCSAQRVVRLRDMSALDHVYTPEAHTLPPGAKMIHGVRRNFVDFHAYRGYGFTHKRCIEADQTRITGISLRIIGVQNFRNALPIKALCRLLYPCIDSYS